MRLFLALFAFAAAEIAFIERQSPEILIQTNDIEEIHSVDIVAGSTTFSLNCFELDDELTSYDQKTRKLTFCPSSGIKFTTENLNAVEAMRGKAYLKNYDGLIRMVLDCYMIRTKYYVAGRGSALFRRVEITSEDIWLANGDIPDRDRRHVLLPHSEGLQVSFPIVIHEKILDAYLVREFGMHVLDATTVLKCKGQQVMKIRPFSGSYVIDLCLDKGIILPVNEPRRLVFLTVNRDVIETNVVLKQAPSTGTSSDQRSSRKRSLSVEASSPLESTASIRQRFYDRTYVKQQAEQVTVKYDLEQTSPLRGRVVPFSAGMSIQFLIPEDEHYGYLQKVLLVPFEKKLEINKGLEIRCKNTREFPEIAQQFKGLTTIRICAKSGIRDDFPPYIPIFKLVLQFQHAIVESSLKFQPKSSLKSTFEYEPFDVSELLE